MSAGWVAATTRGRALLRHTIGAQGAQVVAEASTWPDARSRISTTMYGTAIPPDADRATVRRAAAAATAWQLRVVGGWLPPVGARLARMAVAPMEIANIERHLGGFSGSPRPTPIALGTLGVAWPRIAATTSPEQIRTVLARSAWGDPGGDSRTDITLGLRIAWARRMTGISPDAHLWGHGAIASLIAREQFVFDRGVNEVTAHDVDRLVGRQWRLATTVTDLADRLPSTASWAIADISSPDELWQSEVRIVQRVARDAGQTVAAGHPQSTTVVAILASFLVDLNRVAAAIEAAARGPVGTEVFRAVAS